MKSTKSPKAKARELRIDHWNVDGKISFPVDPYLIAERLNISVLSERLDPDTAGFIIRESGGPTSIYLNAFDAPVRQRFTLAHELGHYVQHQNDPDIGFVDRRNEVASSGTDASEIWANQFAAELLMPGAALSKWWAEGLTADAIRQRLQVSSAALTYRMKNLGLIR
ncbi:ImmA/IrrE family metallo-endopeptidase [Microbacterium enclense]|uniref:ImmA/IrrE family metallo-endopeptidase n=1 Tax=Microbacterium enclense TaxID=993073 RepID=UPI0036DD41AF